MFHTSLGLLRLTAILEGISYLVLLLIAMPLKYFLDFPFAVSLVGAVHGFLFIAYLLMLAIVKFSKRWSILWALWAVLLAFIPFGTFYLDKQLQAKK